MILIPTGKTYSATASGEKIKYVECVFCAEKFVYMMKARTTGQGRSAMFLDNAGAKRRASENATAALSKFLESGCAPVCCPGCGKYQANMVAALCGRKYNWLIVVGVLAGIATGIVSLVYYSGDRSQHNLVYVQSALLFVCLLCIVYRVYAQFTFDPNLQAEERLAAGKGRKGWGVPLAEFQRLLAKSRQQGEGAQAVGEQIWPSVGMGTQESAGRPLP